MTPGQIRLKIIRGRGDQTTLTRHFIITKTCKYNTIISGCLQNQNFLILRPLMTSMTMHAVVLLRPIDTLCTFMYTDLCVHTSISMYGYMGINKIFRKRDLKRNSNSLLRNSVKRSMNRYRKGVGTTGDHENWSILKT